MATANNLGTAYIRIAPQMKGIQSTITNQLGGVGGKAGSAFTSSFTRKWGEAAGIVAGITTAVTSKAIGAITNSLDNAISRVDTLNTFPKIMKNLGFEAEESKSSLDKLSQRIEGLPTTLDEIVTYTQRLASTTGNLNKDMYNATNLAIAFNDAALAGGKGQQEANRAFEQFTQVISRGRPSMQDWKIMMEVMPGQLKQMAKYMGTNNKELQKFAKDAKKTVDQLDGMDLYEWISEDKNAHAKERLEEFRNALIDLDNKGGAGIVSFKDQVGDATHTIGTALRLVPVRITKAVAQVIQAFGTGDIYTTLDKFTSSFKEVGNFVVKYIVPPIKKDVIPAVKNVARVVRDVIVWIAKTEDARKWLAGLLKAFLALKAITAVTSTIKAFMLVLGGGLGTIVKGIAVVKTFAGVIGVGGGLAQAFGAATARSQQFAKAGTTLTASMRTAGAGVMGFSNALSMAGIVLGALAVTIGSFVILTQSVENAETRAANAAKRHQEMLISEKNSIDAINRSRQLEKTLLDDVAAAKNGTRTAEKEELLAKQEIAAAQQELNRLNAEGKKGSTSYRIAEIELQEATERHTEAVKKLADARKEEQKAVTAERDNHFTTLNVQNAEAAAANLRAKNYAAVALQLDNLSKKTYKYKDANGKLVEASKEDMKSAVDYISQQLGREDEVWRTIRENAAKNGTTFVEEVQKYGANGAQRFVGNFSTGVTKYAPLATEAIEGPKGLAGVISNALNKLSSAASKGGLNLGSQLVNGLVNGINGLSGNVANAAKNGIANALEAMRKKGMIRSPSRATAEIGRYLMEGLQVGIESYVGKIEASAGSAMASTIGAMDKSLATLPQPPAMQAYQYQPTTQPTQIVQNNTFNQVANDLDVKEASRKLGWEVATAI